MNLHRRGEGETTLVALIVIVVFIVLGGFCSTTVIHPGEVGVQVTFGTVNDKPLNEGMSVVAPWSGIHRFDVKNQTFKEDKVTVPSQDQLITTLDVSVQYRVIASMAPQILRETGNEQQLVNVQLEPKLRSLLREIGKEVKRAEDFFSEATQQLLQNKIQHELDAFCRPMGLEIQAVLLRDIQLPPVVNAAVQQKKEREQAAVRQEAELQRFTVEQQQKVKQAEAEFTAAKSAAERIRVEADAEAYKIKAINDAASANPVYVQLQALEALKSISKDPAAKLYFMDGQSSTPLPLLHLSDGAAPVAPKLPAEKGK